MRAVVRSELGGRRQLLLACFLVTGALLLALTSASSAQAQSRTLSVATSGSGVVQTFGVGSGIDCGSDCTEVYPNGTNVELYAFPSDDWNLSGFTGDCVTVTGNQCQLTMNANKSVTGVFVQEPAADLQLTITDSPDPVTPGQAFTYTARVQNLGPSTAFDVVVTPDSEAGTASFDTFNYDADCQNVEGTISCPIGTLAPGASAELTFEATESSTGPVTFSALVQTATPFGFPEETRDPISSNNSKTETTFVGTGNALTVTTPGDGFGAVTSVPAGIDCGTDCTETYVPGTAVTLTAEVAPGTGSTFGGWGGACSGASGTTCSLTMDSAKAVVATFNLGLGPPTPVPPVASFTAPATSSAGAPIVFDTTASTGATEYLWDFNNDDRFDFSSGPKQPYVAYKPSTPGKLSVQMVAVAPGGGRSEAVRALTVERSPYPLLNKVETIRSAPAKATFAAPPIRTSPIYADQCTEQTFAFGVVEAKGCLTAITDRSSIPPGERAVTSKAINLEEILNTIGKRGTSLCQFQISLDKSNCQAEVAQRQNVPVMVTKKPVKVSGMTITPESGASVVLFPAAGRIVSSRARINLNGDLGNIPVPLPEFSTDVGSTIGQGPPNRPGSGALVGPLNLDVKPKLDRPSGDQRLPLFAFDAKKLPSIGGFNLDGQIDLAFRTAGARYFSDLTVRVKLPGIFKAFGGGPPPSGQVSIESTNAQGVVLGRLLFEVPNANFGAVRLSKLKFEYLHAGKPDQGCARKWWKAEAQIFLGPGAKDGLNLAPEPQRNGIAFCAGEFRGAGGEFKFVPPLFPVPPQIFPGVFLDSVSFTMDLGDPVLFDGSIGVSAAKILKIKGGFLFAAASPDFPYVIRAADAGGTLKGAIGRKLVATSIAVGGDVGVVLPGSDNKIDLANGYVLYSAPAYFAAEASAKLDTFAYSMTANAGFELNGSNGRFNAFLKGEACLLGIKIAGIGACFGGLAWVSSKGAVVCGYLPKNVWEPGAGIRWNGEVEIFLGALGDGCKPSRFWETNVQGARKLARQVISARLSGDLVVPAARRATSVAFTVKKGETTKNVHLDGAGGAPDVIVRGPDGETITSIPDTALRGKRLRVVSADRYNATWVGVDDAKPGKYLVTLQPGSPEITGMTETRPEPNERLSASVTGKGQRKVLRYDVGRSPGQVVTFYERGRGMFREIGSAKSGKGVIRFSPAPGPGGTREIVALTTVDGMGAPTRVLAKFKAKTPKAGNVRKVRVKRAGKKLVVSWSKARGAAGYTVFVRTRNGVTKTLAAKRSRSGASFKGVPATQSGTVSVAARGPLGDWGKAAKARFKATKKVKDRSLPYSELRRGGRR